jgi:hypothetical protein
MVGSCPRRASRSVAEARSRPAKPPKLARAWLRMTAASAASARPSIERGRWMSSGHAPSPPNRAQVKLSELAHPAQWFSPPV